MNFTLQTKMALSDPKAQPEEPGAAHVCVIGSLRPGTHTFHPVIISIGFAWLLPSGLQLDEPSLGGSV